jgi:hypothetical protein
MMMAYHLLLCFQCLFRLDTAERVADKVMGMCLVHTVLLTSMHRTFLVWAPTYVKPSIQHLVSCSLRCMFLLILAFPTWVTHEASSAMITAPTAIQTEIRIPRSHTSHCWYLPAFA